MAEPERLRLGGMALRNGLLVHGPTHGAAAVRCADGGVRVASGPKPRVRAFDAVPGARGVARLYEAMAVLPLVKRALPEARLPFQDKRVLAGALAASLAGVGARAAARRAGRASLGEAAAAGLSLAPSLLALRGGELAAYHGVEHKAIAAYEHGAADAADAAVGLGSAAVAVEVFAWGERHPDSGFTRMMRRPGFEIQRVIGTREPTPEQLEVGRAALAEILRVEGAEAA